MNNANARYLAAAESRLIDAANMRDAALAGDASNRDFIAWCEEKYQTALAQMRAAETAVNA